MIKKESTRRIIGPVFVACLAMFCILLRERSLIFLGILPVALGLTFFNEGFILTSLSLGLSYAMSFLFFDTETIALSLSPLLIIGIIFAGLIYLKLSAKSQIFISFILVVLIFSIIFRYQMLTKDLTITKLASDLKSMVSSSLNDRFDLEVYKTAIALYPSMIGVLALPYSIIAIKLMRNYLGFSNKGYEDIGSLSNIRIEKKDLLLALLTMIVAYFLARFFSIKEDYILANIIVLGLLLVVANGLSLFDYYLKKSNLPLSRAFQWFFMIILFQILVIPIIFFGIIDIFIDFRSRRKNAK